MNNTRIIFTLLAFFLLQASYAQSPQFSIFDSFEQRPKPGEGTVVVHQSDAIKKLVGTRIENENVVVTDGKTYLTTSGYRIQVYSRNQRASKTEADDLAAKIKVLFPHIDTYTKYFAPFWKLHVGNYLSYEEASVMLRELHKIFAQNKKDIFIIEDDVQLPLE